MADKIFLNSHFAFRSDTLENWQRENPVLENGEPSIVSDGNENEWLKIGDGVTTWNDLPFKTGWIRALYNCNFNNLKTNDENNIVGYKGYKMISSILSDDKLSVDIELRDAELEEKARDKYKVNDKVNIEADTHSYQKEVITAITANDNGNTVVTLKEVDDSQISFELETEDGTDIENWLYVTDKYVGEEIPQFSHAVTSGAGNIAGGYAAFVGGRGNKVYGNYGTVFGRKNIAAYSAFATGVETQALGQRSFTGGLRTLTSGEDSVALGEQTIASGKNSLTAGCKTTALEANAIALGEETIASGKSSFSIGYVTTAEGSKSFSQGLRTLASGENAVALNQQSHANGANSFAIGCLTEANAPVSFAGGSAAKADYEGSFAFGLSVKSGRTWQAVFGMRNKINANALFIVGNGVSGQTSNAFEVNMDGTATVQTNPKKDMDVATKQYVDRLEKEIEILKQAIINLGGIVNV